MKQCLLITMHAYTRLRHFLHQFKKNGTVVYNTLSFLFGKKSSKPHVGLLKQMKDRLEFEHR